MTCPAKSLLEKKAIQETFITEILNFDKEQGAKIHWHSWKEYVKISNLVKFESHIFFKIAKLRFRNVEKFYRRLYGDGQNFPAAIETSANLTNFTELYLRYFKRYDSQTWPVY